MTAKGNTVQSFGLSVLTNPTAQANNEKYSIFNFVAFGDTAEQLIKDHQAGKTYAHIQGAPHVDKYVDSAGNEKKTVSFWTNKISCYERTTNTKQNTTNHQLRKNTSNQNNNPNYFDYPQDEDFAF